MQTTSRNQLQQYRRIAVGLSLVVVGVLGLAVNAWADPLRVNEEEGRKAVITRVLPAVPPLARQAHISGKVVVDINVSESGTVEKVDVVSGNPILSGAVVSATKKWVFQPFQADGKPTKAIVRAAFEFGS